MQEGSGGAGSDSKFAEHEDSGTESGGKETIFEHKTVDRSTNSIIISVVLLSISLLLAIFFLFRLRNDRNDLIDNSEKQSDRITQLEDQLKSLGVEPVPVSIVTVPGGETNSVTEKEFPVIITVPGPRTTESPPTTSAPPTTSTTQPPSFNCLGPICVRQFLGTGNQKGQADGRRARNEGSLRTNRSFGTIRRS